MYRQTKKRSSRRGFRSIRITILVSIILLGVSTGLSQTNSIVNSLGSANVQRLPIPDGLAMLGAQTYQVEKTSSSVIQIRLFNSNVENFATLSLTENQADRSLLVTLSQGGEQAWIRFSRVAVGGQAEISIVSSSGSEIVIRATLESQNADVKSQVLSVAIKNGATTWQNYSTANPGSAEQRATLHQALLAEENRFFNTDRLNKIKEFMSGLDVLSSHASNTNSRDRLNASCTDDTLPRWGEPVPPYRLPGPGSGCGGNAFCTRITTVIPMFFCDGGNSCTGIYIIYDYIGRVFTFASCAYLNNCA